MCTMILEGLRFRLLPTCIKALTVSTKLTKENHAQLRVILFRTQYLGSGEKISSKGINRQKNERNSVQYTLFYTI